MSNFDQTILQKLYKPAPGSHKGQNGKLLVVGGSQLFHAASLWALSIASKIVDMVYYASVEGNNETVQKAKEEFRNGIVIPRQKIADYIKEADCILIGPGLPRPDGREVGDDDTKTLTESLLTKYPDKKWVIDGGSLQVMDPEVLKTLNGHVVITPHAREFDQLKSKMKNTQLKITMQNETIEEQVQLFAKEYNVIVLLKGETDIVANPTDYVVIAGGNAGMTKGGTGDVLAGLTAAMSCKNDLFLAAVAGSYINKKAGEKLFVRVGYYFNASDLIEEIPHVMKQLLP